MAILISPSASVEQLPVARKAAPGWGPLSSLVFRFFFGYWLLYCLPVVLSFPAQFLGLVFSISDTDTAPTTGWLGYTLKYLDYPSSWFQEGINWLTSTLSRLLLGLDVQYPTDISGSGDRLFAYCICFACLVTAAVVAIVWTAASEWRCRKTHERPHYDRLHALLRLIVRLHLMDMMLAYGTMKLWCGQFPPISDAQLETKYGDSSPMGLLWRFMQFSQPYTTVTGVVETVCGLLLISRRTTLLGALLSAGAMFQVWLLNMCYDVPVKLMSGHLILMALTLIVPDAKRLFRFFILGQPTEPKPSPTLFGTWTRLDRLAVVLRTVVFVAFALLMAKQAYQQARTFGILAPENPVLGRWVATEFVRDGHKVPLPKQPENPPPQRVLPSKWQGGTGMPAVIRIAIMPLFATVMFEDGTGLSYRTTSNPGPELVLTKTPGGEPVARLQTSLPQAGVMVLEGPFEGQQVRLTLRKITVAKKDYQLRTRGFRWVQEHPYNR